MPETVIGKSLTIDGEITGTEPLVVHGTVKGKIALQNNVSVAEGGRIEGDVVATSLEISGEMQGNTQVAERLEIKAGGQMQGDIKSPRILIADGAIYRGSIDMDVPESRD